jgi:hypothetical protein
VGDVSAALTSSSEPWLRDRYYSLIDPKEYDGDHGEEDFEYTWDWFQGVRDLFKKKHQRRVARSSSLWMHSAEHCLCRLLVD